MDCSEERFVSVGGPIHPLPQFGDVLVNPFSIPGCFEETGRY